jgi:hypothetical protein
VTTPRRANARERPKKTAAFTGHAVYEECSVGLPEQARFVATQLDLFITIYRRLFSDEHFLTLLRAEAITIPGCLKQALEGEKGKCR